MFMCSHQFDVATPKYYEPINVKSTLDIKHILLISMIICKIREGKYTYWWKIGYFRSKYIKIKFFSY